MGQASHERRLPGGEFRDKECPENTLSQAIKGSCVQTAESTNTTTRNPRKKREGVQGEEDVTQHDVIMGRWFLLSHFLVVVVPTNSSGRSKWGRKRRRT